MTRRITAFTAIGALNSAVSNDKVWEMIRVLPIDMSIVIRFACLTGLRPSEACQSVKLISLSSLDETGYYNQEQQTLEHFRFPDIFLRPTKKAWISYLSSSNYAYFASLGPFYSYYPRSNYTCM